MPKPFRAVLALGVVLGSLALAGCASFEVADSKVLPADKLLPPGSETISRGGYRLESMPISRDAPDLIVMVAFSGGGKRSSSYGYGALKGMRDLMVPTPTGPHSLLSEVDVLTGVSGGSFPAAYYGLYRDRTFGQFETDFLYSDTNSYIFGVYLLPWNWTWIVQPGIGTNDFMDRVYDKTMFHGATFGDLLAKGRPMVGIGATDISYGTPFLFTQASFDLICSDLSQLPLSRAVAASNGFPGLFSPVTLTNHATQCGDRTPGWLYRIPQTIRRDPLSRVNAEAKQTRRYLDADRTKYLHLSDGGVSDNLAMRAAGSMMQRYSSEDVTEDGTLKVRRVLFISVDGQGAQDSTVAQRKEVGGLVAMLGLVSGAQIDSYNFETLTTVSAQLKALVETLQQVRCRSAKVIEGARCDDVQGELVHLSLSEMPPSAERDKLVAIPTGLTIDRGDVDLLVQAGHDAVVNSPALQKFLADYPIR